MGGSGCGAAVGFFRIWGAIRNEKMRMRTYFEDIWVYHALCEVVL